MVPPKLLVALARIISGVKGGVQKKQKKRASIVLSKAGTFGALIGVNSRPTITATNSGDMVN
jgi:hypothetical protein